MASLQTLYIVNLTLQTFQYHLELLVLLRATLTHIHGVTANLLHCEPTVQTFQSHLELLALLRATLTHIFCTWCHCKPLALSTHRANLPISSGVTGSSQSHTHSHKEILHMVSLQTSCIVNPPCKPSHLIWSYWLFSEPHALTYRDSAHGVTANLLAL